MGNRRSIIFLLAGIGLCYLLLWSLPRYARFDTLKRALRTSLLEHGLSGITQMEIECGAERTMLQWQDGKWQMEVPFAAEVDQRVIMRILDLLGNAMIKDFLLFEDLEKRGLTLHDFGIEPPEARLILDGMEKLTLAFGSLTPSGNELFLQVNDDQRILVVDAELESVIKYGIGEMRTLNLAEGDEHRVTAIELRMPERPFIKIVNEGKRWELVQPVNALADEDTVSALLQLLHTAGIAYFIWPTRANLSHLMESESEFQTRLGLYGLGEDAALRLQLYYAGVQKPATLAFGSQLPEDNILSYALVQGGTAIGAVSNVVVDALRLWPGDLQDMRLFPAVGSSISRVNINVDNTTFSLVLTQDAGWRFESPVSCSADQGSVNKCLKMILGLKADDVDKPGTVDKNLDGEQFAEVSQVELHGNNKVQQFSVVPCDSEQQWWRIILANSPAFYRVAVSNMPSPLISRAGILELRDKTVIALPAPIIRRITIKRGKDAATGVERKSADAPWRLADKSSGKISEEFIRQMVTLLGNLQAERTEKLGVVIEDLAGYGLDEPWLTVSVDVDATDAVRKTILIGKEEWFGRRYVMVRGMDTVFVIPLKAVKVLEQGIMEQE